MPSDEHVEELTTRNPIFHVDVTEPEQSGPVLLKSPVLTLSETTHTVEAVMPRGVETLLLVEDDSTVQELGEILLSELGYTVLSAADGVEALETLRAHSDIVLVLTDAIMPRMGAAALIPALRAIKPDVSVLVTSGHARDELHPILKNLGIVGYIQKPFYPADLAVAVRAAIDQAPA